MGWDRNKLLWDGNGTDKYVPWTTLPIDIRVLAHQACRQERHGRAPTPKLRL